MTKTARFAIAALALLGAAAAGPPPEDQRLVPGGRAGFVSDGQDGCWLWASGIGAEARNLTASWTGPCPEGPAEGEGRGIVTWTEGGVERAMIYDGPMRRGKNEGRGRLAIASGGQPVVLQEGRFRDDYFVEGRVEFPRLGLVYEGGWRLSHPDGQGRVTIRGRTFEGDWVNGCLRVPGGGWLAFTRAVRECEETAT
jgi:hypothetical protein